MAIGRSVLTPPTHRTASNFHRHAQPAPQRIRRRPTHANPFGGWQTHRGACTAIDNAYSNRTLVTLLTSHNGKPDAFGLTWEQWNIDPNSVVSFAALAFH